MKRFTLAAALVATVAMVGAAHATTVTWVGGNGTWYVGTGVWATTGGNVGDGSATGEFGRDSGWRSTEGTSSAEAVIDGAGSVVYYNGDTAGDLRWRANSNAEGAGITVSGGATFNMDTTVYEDGAWMQFDSSHFTVSGAGSLFNRYNTPNLSTGAALNGGAMIFGSWKGYSDPAGQDIDVNIADGGEIRNKGQTWFGAYGDEDLLNASLNISGASKFSNDGALENGVSNDDSAGVGNEGEFNFVYSPANLTDSHQHDYSWDFSGHGGNVTLGEEGVRAQVNQGGWTSGQVTYQELWDGINGNATLAGLATPLTNDDILHSGGLNKADNGTTNGTDAFGDYFAVAGSSGSAGYKLTSITGAVAGGSNPGDINGDLATDAADFGTLAGAFGGVGGTVADGDINVGGGGDGFVDAADIGIMFGGWTGDHPPAGPNSATGHYDPATGEIEVDVNGVVNWYVENVGSASMTGDAPAGLPQAPGLVTDNDTRVGESAFAPFAYSQNLGNIAAAGLPDAGTLTIFWNASLGGALQSAPLNYIAIPEPTSLALAGLALCGVMATRRRRLA